MSHHGKDTPKNLFFDKFKEDVEKLDRETLQQKLSNYMDDFAETYNKNMWPNGMLREDDEGVLSFAVGHENKKVVIQFAKETAWLGMTPEQAMGLAQLLIDHAKKAGLSEVVSISL